MAKSKIMVPRRKIRRSTGDRIVQVLIYIFLALSAFITVVPFIYVVAGSFATERELTERAFFLFPHTISLNAYTYILHEGATIRGLMNSIFVTVVGVTINMFFSCTLAYPLSRGYIRGRNFFINMVIITMLFSGGMLPSYILIADVLHLRNTFWSLWLPGAINVFNMIIIKSYFQGLPTEMEESATIDGANDLIIFMKIILPLSKPVLASVSLFYAVAHWNSYFNAMMYISDSKKEVIQIVLRRIVFMTSAVSNDGMLDYGQMGMPPEQSVKMATTVVAIIPILLVYPFIQKYFTQGVMVGAVKG